MLNKFKPQTLIQVTKTALLIILGACGLLFGIILLIPSNEIEYKELSDAEIRNIDLTEETNNYRIDNNLLVLEETEKLNDLAKAKLEDMITRNYWSHYNPDGDVLWGADQFPEETFIGENLARKSQSTYYILEAWKASPTHNENLLNPRFKFTGVACEELENGYTCVQRFSTRK